MSIDGGLRPLFRQHLPEFDWCSIESGMTGGGIPDSNYCTHVYGDDRDGYGIEGWIEYKQTPGWTVTLKPEQVGWIARRVRYGGRVWVAVRQKRPAGPKTGAVDALWLVPGRLAKQAKELGLNGLAAWGEPGVVHVWHRGPANWDWRAVGLLLVAGN